MLRRIDAGDRFPPELLDRQAHELAGLLGGPTLIRLDGIDPRPLFVSVLLHGNEPVGWDAVRRLMRGYLGRRLPRSLALLVGNVQAAAQRRRRLPGQPDFNRVWPDAGLRPADDSDEARMMAELVAELRAAGVAASVDVHNNTGDNPHYGCLNEITPDNLALAATFSDIALYFDYPRGVQTMAFVGHCPALTIECGQVGWAPGVARAADFLDALLHGRIAAGRIPSLHRSVASIRFPAGARVRAAGDTAPGFSLAPGLERWNWRRAPAGTIVGTLHGNSSVDAPRVLAVDGSDASARYLALRDGHVVLARDAVLAMLTADLDVIRADCLCYVLEPIDAAAEGAADPLSEEDRNR